MGLGLGRLAFMRDFTGSTSSIEMGMSEMVEASVRLEVCWSTWSDSGFGLGAGLGLGMGLRVRARARVRVRARVRLEV